MRYSAASKFEIIRLIEDSALGNTESYGDIWVNVDHESVSYNGINLWDVDNPIISGTYAWTVVHQELAHSLGIDIYDDEGDSRDSSLDSHKYTITSYNFHPDMAYSSSDGTGPHAAGLQLFDIASLQAIYGRNYTTREGETIYDKSGAFASGENDESFVYTIWDGNGTDTIDASDYTTAVQIDLRQGCFSSIGNDGEGSAVAWDTDFMMLAMWLLPFTPS